MKTNYTIKNLRNSLAILAIALGSTLTSAQVATEYQVNLRTTASTDYAPGTVDIISDELTAEGTTFKIQATITPGGNGTFVGSSAQRRWGIGNSDTDNETTTFDGNYEESAVINAITIVDFNDNGTGYTVAALSELHFDAITIRAANGANDNPRVTVGGATYDLGQLSGATETVIFGVEFMNAAGTAFTLGDTDTVSSITLANASTNFQNAYQIIGTNVAYTFTTDPNLSVSDVEADTNTFTIYPTIVDYSFSVNKEFKTLRLFDVTGKNVKTFSTSEALEVSGMSSGLYIVKLESEVGTVATSRLIVK
ncbi:T9SS type A sorting domain-containing protein [Winogradskyella wichelsiae]|uniref:T9SS type A sorting domain-containing protein n=1 Tax=Winogradskyella wichelsiae TaxID=2697007 RepID=UPI003EF09B1F